MKDIILAVILFSLIIITLFDLDDLIFKSIVAKKIGGNKNG